MRLNLSLLIFDSRYCETADLVSDQDGSVGAETRIMALCTLVYLQVASLN